MAIFLDLDGALPGHDVAEAPALAAFVRIHDVPRLGRPPAHLPTNGRRSPTIHDRTSPITGPP